MGRLPWTELIYFKPPSSREVCVCVCVCMCKCVHFVFSWVCVFVCVCVYVLFIISIDFNIDKQNMQINAFSGKTNDNKNIVLLSFFYSFFIHIDTYMNSHRKQKLLYSLTHWVAYPRLTSAIRKADTNET